MFSANIQLYAIAAVLILAAPGPSNLLVMTRAAHSLRGGWSVIAGVLAANVIVLGATIFGLSSLVLASQPAFLVMKYAGAGYLAYLGVKLIIQRPRVEAAPTGLTAADGFLTALTNPKALIFYFAFLPQFLTDAAPARLQLIGLAVVDLLLTLLVFSGYALAGAALMTAVRSARIRAWVDRTVGAVLVASSLAVLRTTWPVR